MINNGPGGTTNATDQSVNFNFGKDYTAALSHTVDEFCKEKTGWANDDIDNKNPRKVFLNIEEDIVVNQHGWAELMLEIEFSTNTITPAKLFNNDLKLSSVPIVVPDSYLTGSCTKCGGELV